MGTEMKMANNRSGVDAGHAPGLHIVRFRPGTTLRGRSACHLKRVMKTTLPICCSALLIAGVAWGQDSMTLEQFNALVATPGDTNALRAELASLPFWKVAKCSTALD